MVRPASCSPIQTARLEGHPAAAAAHPAAGEEEAWGGAQRGGAESAAVATAGKTVREFVTGGILIFEHSTVGREREMVCPTVGLPLHPYELS